MIPLMHGLRTQPAGAGAPMASNAVSSLPPGSMGLPVLGDTFAFARNPFGYLDDRHQRHGPVFKARLLGPEHRFPG
jgi:hypothetical protein